VNELEKLLTEKAGLSPEQAQKAVTTIIGFLKERLPAPLAEHLDKLTAGGAGGTAGVGGIMGEAESALGGLFGKK
jgi:hypothetical protein